MKVAYITAGAAGMYCGSCMHDNTLAFALQKMGVDIILIPTYTPLRTDERDISLDRIFFGGVNVYLQQKIPLFRRTPWFLDKVFESPRLLRWVSKFSSSTKAEDLGAFAVSMLKGDAGFQKKELLKLVTWLKDHFQPDLVQITNSMFSGFVRYIKEILGVPVLCSLQGEELFLDAMIEPYRGRAMSLLRSQVKHVDGFVANSNYYREFMSRYLEVAQEKIHVVPLGLNLDGHGLTSFDRNKPPFTIGYLARICPEKGLHLLVDAFASLTRAVGGDSPRLKVAGYLSPKDEPFLIELKRRVRDWGLQEQVQFLGEVDREQKIRFLSELHVFSVPAPYQEPKGLYVLESLANGTPVVQPNHGAFTQMIEDTGGGLLVEPNSVKSLTAALHDLWKNPSMLEDLGHKGKDYVHRCYNSQVMAEKTAAIYREYLN